MYVVDVSSTVGGLRKIDTGAGRTDGLYGVDWLPGGRLVFAGGSSVLPELWTADADGSGAHQITSLSNALMPRTSRDGRWICFTNLDTNGISLYKIAPDGSGLQQLAKETTYGASALSHDGRWLYYNASTGSTPRLMKISTEGGTPVPLTDSPFVVADVSADDSRLLGRAKDPKTGRTTLAEFVLATHAIEPLPGTSVQSIWSPTGELISLRVSAGATEVVAGQVGGQMRTLVPPDGEPVRAFAVSQEGKLVVVRAKFTSDVVLMTNGSR